jgi:antitoxin Phd
MMESVMAWQLQEAKAKFSELVQKAIEEGPQTVTRHGKDAVVVVSAEQFELMKKRQIDLKDLLPYLSLDELDLERNKDFPRDVEL